MAIQFGTVDGLVNVSNETILCFTKGIEEFEKQGGPAYASSKGISYGTAFQRFIEPVYADRTKPYTLSSINQPVLTRSGDEQSPARVTFCKKMGLLKADEPSNIFNITPLGKAVLDKDITIKEYAFILLSKMGVFKEGVYTDNLLCVISSYFKSHATISQEDLGVFIKEKYNDTSIVKTRFDIIINSLVVTGLITKVAKDVYALSGIGQAEVFSDYYNHSNSINKATIDTSDEYADYIGNMGDGGIFNVLSKENAAIYLKYFPNLRKYVKNIIVSNQIQPIPQISQAEIKESLRPYITAIKSKPFLLLAGISGTGKSRIVRELAFKSCPEYLQDKDGTTPGNYCMIEVKPNWHDSTELLGYYSRLGNAGYQFKKFVKFLVKAKMFPKVPFFVCLDEMNLAPVEHYFAEMLSIMETRKHPKNAGTDEVKKEVIKTGTIVDAQYFRELAGLTDKNGNTYNNLKNDRDIYMKLHGIDTECDINEEVGKRTDLTTEGLTLPDNVIIIGTVNMDDTTHQFSRKVIDRAMTIEMNGGKLSNMFGGSKDLEYLPKKEQEKWQNSFRQLYVNADEVLDAHPDEKKDIIEKVPAKLENINTALKGTPYEVSYRVLNELTIMVGVLIDSKKSLGEKVDIDEVINQALDRILLMKILPRIEGDSDMFNLKNAVNINDKTCHNRLEWLYELAPDIKHEEQEGDDHQQTAREKIKEMMDRLENQEFTRFWP